MARGRGGKTGGAGKGGSSGGGSSGGRGRGGSSGGGSSGGRGRGGSSGGGSSGGGSSGGGSSGGGGGSSGGGGGSSGGRGRGGKVGGGGKTTTSNPSVSTQNTGTSTAKSVSTNNPSISTQNNTRRVKMPTTKRPPSPAMSKLQTTINRTYPTVQTEVTVDRRTPVNLTPIRLPNQTISIQNVRYVENPNNVNPQVTQSQNLTPFTIPITKGELTQAATKEFALHLSGTKLIDPQRLRAIQEGRIIVTKGIKTTFTPSEQQLRVLQAMEKQKQAEKDQSRANSEWQKQQDRVQASIQKMEAQKQKTEDFRNRTNEEILQNFIKVQTQKELAGDFGTPINPEISFNPTNLNQYLTERGYDVTKPETIPTSVFKPTRLDTEEKMIAAGLAPRIIQMRLSIDNPNDTVTNEMTNTQIQPSQSVNWNGITETPSLRVQVAERQTASTILYTPPHATNINEPIGRSTPLRPTVTTTGLSSPRQTLVSEAVETVVDPIPSNLSSLALLAGAFILT